MTPFTVDFWDEESDTFIVSWRTDYPLPRVGEFVRLNGTQFLITRIYWLEPMVIRAHVQLTLDA